MSNIIATSKNSNITIKPGTPPYTATSSNNQNGDRCKVYLITGVINVEFTPATNPVILPLSKDPYKLSATGVVNAKSVKVTVSAGSDAVFRME